MVKFENKSKFDYSKVGLSEGLMIDEAFKRNIKVSKPIGIYRILIKNNKKHIMNSQEIELVGRVPVQVTNNKSICKEFLEVSVPKGKLFHKDELKKATQFFKKIKPAVCKPANADYGKYVFLNIKTEKDFKKKFNLIKKKYDVLVEQYFEGDDYRIFVTEKGFTAAAKRIPANVIGDNKHTIEQLVKIKNKSKLKIWKNKKFYVGEIKIGKLELLTLKEGKLTPKSIPKMGQIVFLRKNANISSGGESIQVPMHSTIKKIALNALKSIPNLKYAGIDILTKKPLSKKHTKNDYVIIEVNNMPGMKCHYFPIKGKPKNICGAILDLL